MRSALPRAGWADWRLVQSADSERAWVVCALFVAGKSLVNFVSLSQLLKTANIECVILARRVVGDGSAGGAGGARVCVARCLTPTCARSHDGSMLVFFEHYKEFLSLSQMDDEPLKMLEKSYIVIKMLYDQYRKNYQKLFTYVPLSSVYVPSCVAMTDLAPICGREVGRWEDGRANRWRARGDSCDPGAHWPAGVCVNGGVSPRDGAASTRRRQAPPLEELVFQFGWLLFICTKKAVLGMSA